MICANHFFCFDCGLKAYIPLFVESMTYISVTITILMAQVLMVYCNACGYETRRDGSDPVYKGDCPYHQRVIHSEEGDYLAWEEFDQDGN